MEKRETIRAVKSSGCCWAQLTFGKDRKSLGIQCEKATVPPV